MNETLFNDIFAEFRMTLKALIKRHYSGSRTALRKATGLDEAYTYQLLRGDKRNITLKTLLKFGEAFDMNIGGLVEQPWLPGRFSDESDASFFKKRGARKEWRRKGTRKKVMPKKSSVDEPISPKVYVGRRIRKLHNKCKPRMSQKELALNIGVGRSYMNQIENGRRMPSLATFLRIMKALGIDTADLDSDMVYQILLRRNKRVPRVTDSS